MARGYLTVQSIKRKVGCLQSFYPYHIIAGPEVNDKVFVVFEYDRKWPFVVGAKDSLYVPVRI